LDIRGAAAVCIKDRRTKLIRVRTARRKLRDEDRAVNVSRATTTAVNLARTEHHDHTVEIEVSVERELAGHDQSSLPGGIAWSKHEIAVNKREHTIGIVCAQTRRTRDSSRTSREISSLVDR